MSYGPKAAERIAGKTVLITGASSGIGAATAHELAAASGGQLRLILTARRQDRLDELKAKLTQTFPKVEVLPKSLDVSKYGEVGSFVESLPKEWQDIDVLVNNAGMVHGMDKVGKIALSDVEIMFHTNVLGLIALTQSLVPKFRQRKSGDIVNIGSIAGLEPYPQGSIYCATKAALHSFSHSLRKETIDSSIRVMEIQPGAVETEFSLVRFGGDKTKADAVYADSEPLVAEDIAEVITFNLTRRKNVVIADALVFPSHQASATFRHKGPLDQN